MQELWQPGIRISSSIQTSSGDRKRNLEWSYMRRNIFENENLQQTSLMVDKIKIFSWGKNRWPAAPSLREKEDYDPIPVSWTLDMQRNWLFDDSVTLAPIELVKVLRHVVVPFYLHSCCRCQSGSSFVWSISNFVVLFLAFSKAGFRPA